ncbi:LytR family transcriptional regulator [Streptomyces sp. AJS327]|uniref:LCP family protein n=1 Tax=Streptomyces sp. AJS327 TaxID=2545265 RepID=UPI0015DE347E|nr:LCP family protein [Streptomyces sp. AJS327]MBA0049465.1 LytR family transcriptional regulator [Streptomyces sp. AJS327]
MRREKDPGRGEREGSPSAADRGRDEGRPPRQRGSGPADGRPYDEGYEDGYDDGFEDAADNAPRPKRKRRVLRWATVTLALLILGTAGGGWLYYQHLNGNLTKEALNLGDKQLDRSDPNADGQTPLNILLLGSDSRNSQKNVDLGGSKADAERPPLADVQMLLHVSADRSNMSVISVPRDTKATIPKCTDPDDGEVYPKSVGKINTSLQNGGPGCTVATWEELTGIPIDHFMMIDFAGVVSMADAVGGVPVCVTDNVWDSKSKLKLRKGRSVVKGEQALHWLRTRHGFGDGTDIGRAKAQHMYMNAMVRQLKSGTKLSDPGKMRGLAEAATEALTVDNGLDTIKKLYDLGNDLKRVPTKRITMATMPWEYGPGGYVLPKPDDAEKVFSLVRNDVSLDGKDKTKPKPGGDSPSEAPASPKNEIPIRVMNGTGTALQPPVSGRAGVLAGHLTARGFAQATADQSPQSQADTTITYPKDEQRADALLVAKELGLPERLVKHSAGAQEVTLVIGADWRDGTAYPKPEGGTGDGAKKPGDDEQKAPDSAEALNGDDKKACMKVNPAHTW